MRSRAAGILIATLVALVALVILAAWIGARRQDRALTADLARLRASASVPSERADLVARAVPAPVARYLSRALADRASIGEVRLAQTGTLRTDTGSERWMAFEAEHVAVPAAAGFLWNARVRVAPLVHVRVKDALIAGRGSGQVELWSAFTVGADAGTPEMNAGSLHRYLAEAVWYPTALEPSETLRWTTIDDTTALATLTVHGTTVSLEFRFGGGGEVTGIYTPARWGTFEGGYRQVPWEGHFGDYQVQGGLWVPMEGEVGWYVDERWQPVWKGRLTSLACVGCR